MEIFLIVLVIIVLAAMQEQVDLKCLNKDYEEWKKNRGVIVCGRSTQPDSSSETHT